MNTPSPDLSLRLAEHVAGARFDALPPGTVHAARRALLDGLGVMLAASGESGDVQPFIGLARRADGTGTASVLGTEVRTGAALAALANGAMAHALDYEDAYDAAPVHPNASLIPALLALAQTAPAPVSGREFLTALAVGCDFACRLARCLERSMEQGGWYPPAILAAYGAAAGAARLLRLDVRQTLDAWSLMLCQATCPGEIKYSADTVIRAVREAFPAQAAVQSALLARAGVRGFDAPFEGRSGFFALYVEGAYSATRLLEELGRHWLIDDLSFKPWPCCRGTHAYIEAAQTLRKRHALRAEDIAEIHIGGGSVQRMLYEPETQKRRPRTLIDAKFSLPFTVAAALVHPEVTLGSFTPQTLADPGLLALADRCRFELRPDWGHAHAAAGELRLISTDGREFDCRIPQALGHPSRPLADTQLHAKFAACAARAAQPWTAPDIDALAARILALDLLDDVSALLPAAPRPAR